MPLIPDAAKIIRKNIKKARTGKKPGVFAIGTLTANQLADLNKHRVGRNQPPMTGDLVFRGSHIYDRRICDDGYSVSDVIQQILNATSADSIIVFSPKMTVLRSVHPRIDSMGNRVVDEVVLECTGKHPRAEIYGVIPRGDILKPGKIP